MGDNKPLHKGQLDIINAVQGAINRQSELERKAAVYDDLLSACQVALINLRSADAIDLAQRVGFNQAKKQLEAAIARAEDR